nr:UBP-type zinc finger domain-containing protein [Nocardia crassostreae]
MCLECGHVACCDSSVGNHATKHFHATGHPVMRSGAAGYRTRSPFRACRSGNAPTLAYMRQWCRRAARAAAGSSRCPPSGSSHSSEIPARG